MVYLLIWAIHCFVDVYYYAVLSEKDIEIIFLNGVLWYDISWYENVLVLF